MKLFILTSLLFSLMACQSESTNSAPSEPAATTTDSPATHAALEEDCDEKAKKPIEIKEETISLNNSTGCTLE